MTILVTGGAGYIGSHTCVELLKEGYEVIIADNFINSKPIVLENIREITGRTFKAYNINLVNKEAFEQIFKENNIDAVIHFAALKAVGESVEKPIEYYSNNLISTLNLCELMKQYNVKKIVFSSSATVYGKPKSVPIKEDFPTSTTNPYGTTKLMIENILKDIYEAHQDWSIVLLRYFNPIGAHESGLIGENPNGIPNNLLPYVAKVAVGELDHVRVFGNDYDTLDGTGVRDYIHVVDLAKGHVKALDKILNESGLEIYNLGTGNGYSVLQIIEAFEKVCGKKINYEIVGRRAGDIDICYADTTKAEEGLNWKATKDIEEMCKDSWHFICLQTMNGMN